MPSDLIAVVFDEADTAEQAWQFTARLRDRQLYGLASVALVTQGPDGKPTTQYFFSPDVPENSRSRKLLTLLAGKLFVGPNDLEDHQLSSAGLDSLFVEQVAQSMGPEHSALLIYLPADSLADVNQLLAFLNLMKDTVFRTTLPFAVEDTLLSAALRNDQKSSNRKRD